MVHLRRISRNGGVHRSCVVLHWAHETLHRFCRNGSGPGEIQFMSPPQIPIVDHPATFPTDMSGFPHLTVPKL